MADPNSLREQAQRNLSDLIITIEFTLISVMIGVVLFPLADRAKDLIVNLQYEYWLYVISGLLFILYMWTEVISHSLSFVGWPIEFGHNLLYIVFTMTLNVQMNFLDDPTRWFALTFANTVLAAIIILYDRRVIAKKSVGAHGADAEMYRLAMKRQNGLVRVFPLSLLFALIPLGCIVALPQFFIQARGHLIFVAIQILTLLVLLVRTIQTFSSWTEPILQKEIEELE